MRRVRLLLLSLSIASQALAADANSGKPPFQVVAITAEHPTGNTEYSFPNFKGVEPAATAINTFLQAIQLHKLPGRYRSVAFEDVWPKGDSFVGLTELNYVVGEINARYASIELNYEYSAAYPSSYSREFTFDSHTGAPIGLDDLFTDVGLKHLQKRVSAQRVTTVREHIKQLSKSKEVDADDRAFLYKECLPAIRDDDLSENEMQVAAGSITLSRGDCGPHVTLALEDLRAIPVTLKGSELSADLSAYGRCLLIEPLGIPACMTPSGSGLVAGVHHGTLGKSPITLVIDSNFVNAGYFYDKYAKWIELSRTDKPNDSFEFREGPGDNDSDDGKTLDGVLTLHSDPTGKLSGRWSSSLGGKILPIELSPPDRPLAK